MNILKMQKPRSTFWQYLPVFNHSDKPHSIKNHVDFLEAIILYRIREEDIGIDWEEEVCQRESGKLQGLLAQTDDVLEPRDIWQLTIR